MKIPKSINILGVKYKIKLQEMIESYGEIVSGTCDTSRKIILICNTGQTEDDVFETFLHELNHAIYYETGLSFTSINADVEEIIVNQFAAVYMKLFKLSLK